MLEKEKKKLRVLEIEDDEIDQKQIQRLLAKSFMFESEALLAGTLEEGLDILEAGKEAGDPIDVILLDLNLPDSNGMITLSTVKDRFPQTATIVATGLSDQQMGLEAVSKGAQDYLVKGEFDMPTLSKCIYYAYEREKVETELQESQEHFRSMVANIPGVIYRCANDHQWSMEFISDEVGEMTGYESSVFLEEKEVFFVDIIHEDDLKNVQSKIESAISDKVPYVMDYRIVCKSGKVRWVHEKGQAVYNSNGDILCRDGAIFDITVRKQAEMALMDANQEMKEMQSQIIQSEKLASIGQLAAGVAHEMNTPVGFVASNFETLSSYLRKISALLMLYKEIADTTREMKNAKIDEKFEEIEKYKKDTHIDFIMEDIQSLFDESKEGLARVTSIIQNLRDFSRVDQATDMVEYSLNKGIEATLVVARNEIKYDADLHTDFGEVPSVLCNSGQINQVFLNILVNAAQAIKNQEDKERGNISIKTSATDEHVVCEIEDDGPGIKDEVIKRVFDPFFTTKPVGKGTGLGLSVSYDIIVNKHKGELSVDSEIGKGTKFTIKLPLSLADSKNETENINEEVMANG